jgi:hypothetical protein
MQMSKEITRIFVDNYELSSKIVSYQERDEQVLVNVLFSFFRMNSSCM